jgi:hypothetical protein
VLGVHRHRNEESAHRRAVRDQQRGGLGVLQPGAPAEGLQLTNDGFVTFAGGIPLKSPEGEPIGAIGISGSDVPQDAQVAAAGAAAILSSECSEGLPASFVYTPDCRSCSPRGSSGRGSRAGSRRRSSSRPWAGSSCLPDSDGLLAIPEGHLDPEEMIRRMIEIVPADTGKFRNVCPQFVDDMLKQVRQKAWERTI